ncbi:unnamed protein product [Alopecurus aequalis]
MGAIHTEDEPRGCDLEKNPWAQRLAAFATITYLLFCVFVSYNMERPEYLPDFWVKLPAVEGLDRASTGASRAPTFKITLRVDNPAGEPWHFSAKKNGTGRVVVAYQGVPLAHADLPEFSMPGGIISSVPIVATSEGLGMPDELAVRSHADPAPAEGAREAIGAGDVGWCAAVVHGDNARATTRAVCLPKTLCPTFSRTDPRLVM